MPRGDGRSCPPTPGTAQVCQPGARAGAGAAGGEESVGRCWRSAGQGRSPGAGNGAVARGGFGVMETSRPGVVLPSTGWRRTRWCRDLLTEIVARGGFVWAKPPKRDVSFLTASLETLLFPSPLPTRPAEP